MRLIFALLLVAIAGCSPQDVEDSTGKARFTEYPDRLFAAFEASCSTPAQSFSRPSPDLVECREYLPPEHTAALILGFDGTPKDLPQLVVQFSTTADGSDYLVEHDIFMNVPQKSGQNLHLQRDSHSQRRTLVEFYKRSGGKPE